jgi:hypothetical protein
MTKDTNSPSYTHWDSLTRSQRVDYAVKRIPHILEANGGEMKVFKLSLELTGQPHTLAMLGSGANNNKFGGYGNEIFKALAGKVVFSSKDGGKRKTCARLVHPLMWNQQHVTIRQTNPYNSYPLIRNCAPITNTSSSIDSCVEALLMAVKNKAQSDLSEEINALKSKISELERDKTNLAKVANNPITSKFFNFKSV